MRYLLLAGAALAALTVVGPAVADEHGSHNIICTIANGGGSNTHYSHGLTQTQCAVNIEAFSGNDQSITQKQMSIYSLTDQSQSAANFSLGGGGGSQTVTQHQAAFGGWGGNQSQGGVNISLGSSGSQSISQSQVSVGGGQHGD